MISNLGPGELPPYDKREFALKVIRDNAYAASWFWPVPRPGYWENPRGVSYDRVAHLESMRNPEIAAWIAGHRTPGTMIVLSNGLPYELEREQVEDAPVLRVLVNDTPDSPEARLIREETRAEHYQRTGLQPPEQRGK
jgi:hypothetical protein